VGNGKRNIGAAVVNLAAAISGPWLIDTAGNHQWTANASGGDASYSYQWYYRAGTSGAWTPVGTNQTYSRWVDPEDPDFQLRVVVESMGVSVTHQRMIETDPCGDQEICE
jgi:hypothetical protein